MANPKVPQEFWVSYIIEKLRRVNPHLAFCFDESSFVKGGSVVYIPQAGNSPGVQKNRTVFPATATQRADHAIMYALDVFTSDPTFMTYQETNEISYAKQDSVFGDHTDSLAEAVGDEILYAWTRGLLPAVGGGITVDYIPVARQLKTTGAAAAVNAEDGQTGTRYSLTEKDLSRARAKFNKDNVPTSDRYALIESFMLEQLMDSLSNNQMATFQQAVDVKNGILGKLHGFQILDRSSTLAFGNVSNQPIVPGQALAATDNLAVLCWHKNSVGKAVGDTELFQDNGNPVYYGDVASGAVKMGGRCRRKDWKGVLAIVQGIPA